MEIYLFKTAACWAILYGFYKLVLERESMHSLKRWYLLGGLLLGALIPLIEFTTYVYFDPGAAAYIISSGKEEIIQQGFWQSFDWGQVLWAVYWLGVGTFGLRFIWNFGRLVRRIWLHPTANERTLFYVLLGRPVQPHTFFKYIFVNKKRFKEAAIPKEVLLHEQAHAKQLHSADVLLVELMQVVFWFNPLIYLIKHSIQLNHEFLADRAVLKTGVSKSRYQNTLLAYLNPRTCPELASAINYSSIKKRFTLMKNSSSKKTQWVKGLLLLPLLAMLLYSFSSTNEVLVEEEIPLEEVIELSAQNLERTELLEVNHPTYKDFQRWQDASQYGLWVDGKRVSNSEILEYHPDDLPYFSESRLAKNAVNYGKYSVQVNVMSNSYWQDQIGLGFVTPGQQKEIIKEALQDNKELKIKVEGKTVYVNGVKTALKDFRKTVDKATKNWEKQDYTNSNLELRISNPNYAFMQKLNDAYKQTNFYKANPTEYGLNPPPPPPPPAPDAKNVIIEEIEVIDAPPPPPPPAPGKSVDVIVEEIITEDGVKRRVVKRKNVIEEIEIEEEIEEGELKEVIEVEEIEIETPPPPPPPKSPLQLMKEMKKKGALFFLNGKSISADEAIEWAKKDQELQTIDVKGGKNGKYKVYLVN